MNLQKIAQQYYAHAAKQFRRAKRQHRDLTRKELAGVAYYRTACGAVSDLFDISEIELINETGGEGFVMKTAEELAPINSGFKPMEGKK